MLGRRRRQDNSGNTLVCRQACCARVMLHESCDELCAIGNLELGENTAQMVFHRTRADKKLLRDLFVGQSARKGVTYFLLSQTQLLSARRGSCRSFVSLAWHQCLALQTGVNDSRTCTLACAEIRRRGFAVEIE